jgi:hypothetical protein
MSSRILEDERNQFFCALSAGADLRRRLARSLCQILQVRVAAA